MLDSHEALKFHPISPIGVGDINGTERGSGARYNSGKPDYSLIPLRLMADHWADGNVASTLVQALHALGDFQAGGSHDNLWQIIDILECDWSECAHVFDYGRKKYSAWNWVRGMVWSIPIACIARHLERMSLGELQDSESGLPHRGHVMCNIVMLLTYANTFTEGDDRPAKGLLQ